MVSNLRPFIRSFSLGKRKKSQGARSGEYAGWGTTVMLFLAKNCETLKDLLAGALSWWIMRFWFCHLCDLLRRTFSYIHSLHAAATSAFVWLLTSDPGNADVFKTQTVLVNKQRQTWIFISNLIVCTGRIKAVFWKKIRFIWNERIGFACHTRSIVGQLLHKVSVSCWQRNPLTESVNPLINRRVTWSGKINVKKIVGSTNLKLSSQIKGNKTKDSDFLKLIISVGKRQKR